MMAMEMIRGGKKWTNGEKNQSDSLFVNTSQRERERKNDEWIEQRNQVRPEMNAEMIAQSFHS